MSSLVHSIRRAVTIAVLATLGAATAEAQTPVGAIPICVATLTHLYYGPNTEGQCFRGHSLLAAAANAALEEVSTAMAALRAEVDALKASVPSGLADRVTALEGAVTALGSRIDGAGTALSEAVTALTQRQDATDASIAQLRAELQAELQAAVRGSITSPDGKTTVSATDNGVVIKGGPTSFVRVEASSFEVKAPNFIRMDGGADFDIKAQSLSFDAGQNLDMKAGLAASMKAGSNLTIDASQNVDIKAGVAASTKALTFTIDGAATGQIKAGSLLNLNGGGCPVAGLNSRVVIPATAPAGQTSTGLIQSGATTVFVPCSP